MGERKLGGEQEILVGQVALDILAIAPHPDDAEIGAGGTLAQHVARGYRVGICDLTRGELGTNGTAAERLAEAEEAAKVLGLAWRGNLGLPDRGLQVHPDTVGRLALLLRQLAPRVLLVPAVHDSHPDHQTASRLCYEAVMTASLPRWQPDPGLALPCDPPPAHRPAQILYYFVDRPVDPSLLVDVSGFLPRKMEALRCHASQFIYREGRTPTDLNDGHYLRRVEMQARYLGALVGREAAEPFLTSGPRVVTDLIGD